MSFVHCGSHSPVAEAEKRFAFALISFAIMLCPHRASAGEPERKPIIAMERSACQTECPEYRVEIYADGHVAFDGKAFVKHRGKATGRTGIRAVEALLNQAVEFGFFETKSVYASKRVVRFNQGEWYVDQDASTHCYSTTTEIAVGPLSHRVEHCEGAPPWLKDIEEKIDKVAGTVKWIR